MKRLTIWLALLSVLGGRAETVSQAATATSSFVPGHAYVPSDNGLVVELDKNLDEVRRFHVNDVDSATGAVFNDVPNLVFIARQRDTVRILEVDADGQIVDEFVPGRNSLLRGSYIDFDPVRRIYAFANDDRVTLLDANLSKIAETPAMFQRASGVGFAPDGRLFATDQFQYKVFQFDSTFRLERTFDAYPGRTATGLDVAANGAVLTTSWYDGTLYRLDPVTGERTTVIEGLGMAKLSDVVEIPGGQLLTIGGPARLYSADGQLLHFGATGGGDSIAFLVPEPSTLALLVMGVAGFRFLSYRRRKV